MNQVNYRFVSAPTLRMVRRGETTLIKVRFRNTGKATWFDIGKKQEPEHVVLDICNKEELLDFRVRWGEKERTNRKFSYVMDSNAMQLSRNQHVAKPGEIAAFHVQLTARAYATKGLHRIEFAPKIFETNQKGIRTGRKQKVWIYVRAKSHFWFHLKRTIRLWLIKPGRVDNVFSNKVFSSRIDQKTTPVVMATWQRIESLSKTLESLLQQKDTLPVLYIWNNNKKARHQIDRLVSNSKLPVSVWHSHNNIGGFGRFYLAKELAAQHGKVIFIDDDQFPERDYIVDLLKEYEPKTVKSQWAFSFPNIKNYWHKQLAERGEEADYCGTGGMIADTSIFLKPELFKCPKRYWFIEDLWLSFFAKYKQGWKLERSTTDLEIQEDGKDQFTRMIDLKTKFLKHLCKRFDKFKYSYSESYRAK